ncbi:MAG: fasciclin domain-containing protein [Jiangellales bacterium]
MRVKKAIAGVTAAAAALAGGVALAGPAQATGKDTILDLVTAADRFTGTERDELDKFRWDQRNWYDFDILTKLVAVDGTLLDAVQSPEAAVTLFAPNDRAFQLLAKDLTGRWFATETQTFNALAAAVASGDVNLTNVLTYHVVDGKVVKADVPFNTPVTTLNGGDIKFKKKWFGIRIQDEVSAFRNPTIIRTDIGAKSSHSVIHSISRVLIPANVGG